jgi:hypothetical protein
MPEQTHNSQRNYAISFLFINDNVFNDLIHLTTKIFSRNLIFLTIIRLVFTEPIHQKPILLFQSPSLLLPLN